MNSKALIAIAVAAVVIVAAVVVLLLQKQAPAPGPGPEEEITLRVATRHDSTIQNVAYDLFMKSSLAKEYKIKDIVFVGVNPNLWVDTIKGAKDQGMPFDLAWGGGPTLFDDTLATGLLAPFNRTETLQTIAKIKDTLGGATMKRTKDGKVYWCAAAISSFGFIVNSDILGKYSLPEPRTWEDLASTDFAKILPVPSISFASPSLSTSHTRIYEIVLSKFGWDLGWTYLARLAANGRAYSGSVEALTAVQSGEVPVGIAIDFYGFSSELQFPSTKYTLPFNESIVNGDPIALLTTSAHSTEAQAFIQWVLSTDGQVVWLDDRIARMPVVEEVFRTPEGKDKTLLYRNYNRTIANIGIPFDDNLVIKYEYALRVYFDSVLGDVHDDLVAAWSKIAKAYASGSISRQQLDQYAFDLGKPITWEEGGKQHTFTLDYAVSINESLKDTNEASRMAQTCRNAARNRYTQIASRLP